VYCFDNPFINPNGDDIPILTGQGGLWLGVEIGGSTTSLGPTTVGHVAVCASTTPPGSTGPETLGENITVNVLATGWSDPNTAHVGCNPDTNPPTVAVTCNVATTPTYSINGTTLSVTIPIALCLNTTLTGQVTCSSASTGIGTTGVIVTTIGLGGGPGGTTGASVSPNTTLYVDGIAVPLAQTGAGVSATVSPGTPVTECVVICTTLPGEKVSIPATPAPLGAVVIDGIPLTIPNPLPIPICAGTPQTTCP
jgi:hypothetical protein